MAARPEVVALPTDFDLQRTGSGQRLVHRNGTPFSTEETDLLGSATDDDMRAAASELAAAPERLAELFMPSIRTVAEPLQLRPQPRVKRRQQRPDVFWVHLLGPGGEADQSANSTVTTLRSSTVTGATVTSAAPHSEQNFAPAAF